MLHKRRTSGTRKVSPPQPTCMTPDQQKNYLASLRQNRPTRPIGARPLPGTSSVIENEGSTTLSRSTSAVAFKIENINKRYSTPNSTSVPSIDSLKGRPLIQAPIPPATVPDNNGSIQPGALKYRESVSRDAERKEANSLRQALDRIDHADDESRIYTAAQQEAADLVWKHLNPRLAEQEKTAAYRNPDLGGHRKKPSFISIKETPAQNELQKSVQDVPAESEDCKVEALKLSKRGARHSIETEHPPSAYSNRRRSSGKRTASNGSNKGVFRNPEDQIYEEPEHIEPVVNKQEVGEDMPLQSRPRNPLLRGSRPLPEKTYSTPLPERPRFNPFEIHRNAPSQTRRADYTANPPSREATPEIETPKGRAMEIRSDEIRAATSMKRKDRSPKLPTPTAVSDRLGRPIVSFDPTWRAGNESPKTSLDIERPGLKPLPLTIQPMTTRSAPAVPTISLPEDDVPTVNVFEHESVPSISISAAPSVPTINLPGENDDATPNVPSINVSSDEPVRPLPQITVAANEHPKSRPLPTHSQSLPSRPPPSVAVKTHRTTWLSRGPAIGGATATCNACQLPIAGRIVTASGSVAGGPKTRFHPECFTCHHCSTALECVSFYPEPATAREERLQRDDQADPSEMRFYCHLDFHDLFSPRCASCKTPIEGAVILAAGKSWHEGHFFCAECGDPFSSSSPFVEDKGYAYCVCCHTKRTSARCRKCKKQILEEVSVEALGGKWHDECFRCDDCDGDFGEDGRFFVREVEVELTDKERRKGMGKKFEDRAVCRRCEELRLRRVDSFL